jgi:hypothetical protein
MTRVSPDVLETKIDLLLVQQAELKEAIKELRGNCRMDMQSVYVHVNAVEDAMDERMRQVEAHAACQRGKGMSWDKLVLVGTALFVFFQALAAWWPKV